MSIPIHRLFKLVVCAALAGVAVSSSAASQERDEGPREKTAQKRADPWHLNVEGTTDVPIAVGARVGLETPDRLRLSTSLGYLPGAYVDLINDAVVAAGGYDRETAELVSASLQQSLVWRTHVGVRPFRSAGLYADAGYGLITLGGGVTQEQLGNVVGMEPLFLIPERGVYGISSTLHMLDVELGWELVIADTVLLRMAIGGAFTMAASTDIEPAPSHLAPQLAQIVADAGEAYLDDVYTSYVFTPVISLGLGYRLF